MFAKSEEYLKHVFRVNFCCNFDFVFFDLVFRAIDPHAHSAGRRRASSVGSRAADHLGAIGEDPGEEDDHLSETETEKSDNNDNVVNNDFLSRPYWVTDEGLKKGEVDVLSHQEELFWTDLLDKYLYPIDEDKAEKVKYTIFLSR